MENSNPPSEQNSKDSVRKDGQTLKNNSDNEISPKVDPPQGNKSKSESINNKDSGNDDKLNSASVPKKPPKPPKLEDKPFEEFINNHLIPGLKESIQERGTIITDIKLIEGNRPVVGGNCWMIFCEISDQRKFWLCFNEEKITSNKTILLAESNSDPSVVESFLIDEKKTTLALLISRVLQRLNGQKWIGIN